MGRALDSRRLEIFCAVAETGSFTAAAERLHLTQSAVSQQVAILERDLGLVLLERVARGVRLAPAGEFLARRARALLQEMNGLAKELQHMGRPAKTIRLGVFATAGAHLVPALVQAYRQQLPETQLTLVHTRRDQLAARFAAGEIDVGLTWEYDFLMQPISGLQRWRLFDDPMQLLLPRDHRLAQQSGPIRLVEAADEPWIVRIHQTANYDQAFETMCRIQGFEPQVAFRTEDYASTQGFVAANVGVAVAPLLSLQAQRPDIVVRPIGDPGIARHIDAVAVAGAEADPNIRELIRLLKQIGEAEGGVRS